ncbi:MAG: UvrD-helicase domain-containing protein [Chitinispirillaceae bacterium]|nr:UvrD-helicase domain-containing protein [Chitinispirillaceae bacterium]
MRSFVDGLNESQKKAVLHNGGPLLVLAGAGSGKTKVLTMRIARLVHERHCSPEEILAVTFTNKAAREMRERVAQLTSQKMAEAMTLSTFHSLGVKILRECGESIGLKKNFTIIDEHEKIATLKSIMRANGVRGLKNEDPEDFAVKISLAKSASISPDVYKDEKPDETKIARVYASYSSVLLRRQTVDFDDLLLLPLQIFTKHPDLLKKYQSRYHFVSIDEFQDTNAAQMRLASLLSHPQNNLMVVGDDDQGIYSWRGAEIGNILSFSAKYKNCVTIILDVNYRSSHQIVAGAHGVVANNRVRKHKVITAHNGDGDPIMHYKGDDEEDEALWIASKIQEHNEHTSWSYADHAILLRTNAMMRRYEEQLRKKKIPYTVSGATSFYERKEIKDVISYLRFFANPEDEISMMRVLKVPNKGITPSSLELLDDFAGLRKMSLWDAMVRHRDVVKISDDQHDKIDTFVTFFNKYDKMFRSGALTATIRTLLTETKYLEHLARAYKDEDDRTHRVENVEEMLHGIEIYERKFRKKTPTLSGFLQEIALMASETDDSEKDSKPKGVTMMTLHKSKGLEFPVVFLAGLDKDYVPSPRAIQEGNIDEERRLFYVGMTRARQRLYCTYPGTKVSRGKIRTVTPCPFLREIPEEYLDGKIGEREDQEKMEYLDDFFKKMKERFNGDDTSEPVDAEIV